MKIKLLLAFCLIIVAFVAILFMLYRTKKVQKQIVQVPKIQQSLNLLTIAAMRKRQYPGSTITIEQTLPDATNYHQYIASYLSDGLKIYALLTVPLGQKPAGGWPIILFNHGYITPQSYQTNPSVGQYATYLSVFARNGYIVFKPDYRGNGNSQGSPEGAYYSPAYTVDDLNALSSIKRYPDANPEKIGIWGHSMGGNISLRDLVVDPKDIKVAVIWGGVVGSYADLEHWHDPSYHPSTYELSLRYRFRANLEKQYGTPESDPTFWNSIDPTKFLSDISAPVQLHVGEADEEVPPQWSENLYNKLSSLHKTVEFYSYPGANHNIAQGFDIAMQRSVAFFDKYLK